MNQKLYSLTKFTHFHSVLLVISEMKIRMSRRSSNEGENLLLHQCLDRNYSSFIFLNFQHNKLSVQQGL